MNTITSQQAADIISDDYQTSPAAVEAVSEEAVEDYVEVSSAPSEGDILGYNADAVDVNFNITNDEYEEDAAGKAIVEMTEQQKKTARDVDDEKVEADMGANFAVAYGREVANQALEVTDGDEEAAFDALNQAYTQLEERLDSQIELSGGHSRTERYVSDVEEVFQDFQEEVDEMLG